MSRSHPIPKVIESIRENIYFVGPRACGKTTLGMAVAGRLERKFLDTDHLFEKHAGNSITDYVEEKGWEGFRDLEAEVLAAVDREEGKVVACGGGIVLRPENRDLLKKGLVFYRRTSVETLVKRLEHTGADPMRPTLTGKPVHEEIAAVLAEREPLYEKVATVILPGGEDLEESVDIVVHELARLAEERQG